MKLFDEWDLIESDNGERRGVTLPQAVMLQGMFDALPRFRRQFGAKSTSTRAAYMDAMIFLLITMESPEVERQVRDAYRHAKLTGRLIVSTSYQQYEKEQCLAEGRTYDKVALYANMEAYLKKLLDIL